jgi:hypothetical protein
MKDGDVILSAETYDRFHDSYVALADALIEAREYVSEPRWPSASQRELLKRIDSALVMDTRLTKEQPWIYWEKSEEKT